MRFKAAFLVAVLQLMLPIAALAQITSVSLTGDGTITATSVSGSPITTSGTLNVSTFVAPAYSSLVNRTSASAAPTWQQASVGGDMLGFQSGGLLDFYNRSNLGGNADPINQAWCQHWNAAKARVLSGSGIANIFPVGDSVTAGQGVSLMSQSWPLQLKNVLNSYAMPCREGVIWASSNPLETRWTYTGGWFQSSVPGGFGASGPASAAGTAKCDPGAVTSDEVVVFYAAFSGGGTFTVSRDGTTTLGTINSSNASNEIKTQSYSIPSGTHYIEFSAPTAQVYPVGVWFRDTTSPCVYVTNSGISGKAMAFAGGFINAGAWPFKLYIKAVGADLCPIILGINDAQSNVTAVDFGTTTNSNVAAIQSLSPNTDILLVQEHAGASAGGGVTLQAQYAAPLAAAARQYHCGFLDLFNRWGSVQSFFNTTLGYGGPLHPNAVGMADYSRALFSLSTRN